MVQESGARAPQWSGSGEHIVWNKTVGAERGVWVMTASGDSAQLLIPFGHTPDWHPERAAIVCDGSVEDSQGILEYDIDQATSTLLRTDVGDYSSTPRHSPDGTRIAFTVDAPGSLRQIWVMGAVGTEARQLTFDGGYYPSWSPDGTRVVYTRENGHSDSPTVGVLWAVNVEDGTEEQMTHKEAEGNSSFRR